VTARFPVTHQRPAGHPFLSYTTDYFGTKPGKRGGT
jgi:hypothetical protein